MEDCPGHIFESTKGVHKFNMVRREMKMRGSTVHNNCNATCT